MSPVKRGMSVGIVTGAARGMGAACAARVAEMLLAPLRFLLDWADHDGACDTGGRLRLLIRLFAVDPC